MNIIITYKKLLLWYLLWYVCTTIYWYLHRWTHTTKTVFTRISYALLHVELLHTCDPPWNSQALSTYKTHCKNTYTHNLCNYVKQEKFYWHFLLYSYHTNTHIHIHNKLTRTHTCIHTHIYTNTHTYMHTHIYTHLYAHNLCYNKLLNCLTYYLLQYSVTV